MDSLFKLLMTFGSVSTLLPFFSVLIRWKRLKHEQLALAYLVLLSALIEGLSLLLGRGLGMQNIFLIHIFTIGEFALIMAIFSMGMKSAEVKKWAIGVGIGFSVFSVINSFFFERWDSFNWLARIVEACLVVAFSAHYYYKTSRELKVKRLEKTPMFWLVNALFIYFSSSFVVFLFSNYMLPKEDLGLSIWAIHALLVIIKNILFTYAIWMNHPTYQA